MLQNQEIQLNPIIDADPVQFTIDTIGWKIVFILVIATLVVLIYKYYLRYKKNEYRRVAISKIRELSLDKKNSMSIIISKIMFELKQTALQSYDRKKVAALEGERWLQFLDKTLKQPTFSKYHEIIVNAVYKDEYKQDDSFNLTYFADMSIKWIKNHA